MEDAPFWIKLFLFCAVPWAFGAVVGMAIMFVTLFIKMLWNAQT